MKFLWQLTTFLGIAAAARPSRSLLKRGTDTLDVRTSRPSSYAVYTFDQVIDHYPQSPRYEPHAKGTFKQRYCFDDTYYKPGGPVFLYLGGETAIENRFPNLETGIIQILMQATNGLGVILENRYYGKSYPFNNSTTDNLAYLTTEQTIFDNAYFAQHVNISGHPGLNAPQTPWILYGGSLAGGQVAFSIKAHGDTLYGGISSSGLIHAVLGYPQWYDPIQKFAPQDCVTSINNIVDKMDMLINSNMTHAVQQLKDIFGLGSLQDIRDFAMTIAFPLGGPLNYPDNTWQELNWDPAQGSFEFFDFCGNVTNLNPPQNNTAVDYELANYTNNQPWTNLGNYAAYVKRVILPFCPNGDYNNVECFGTQNQSYWADPTNGLLRSYLYTTCTEMGAYQVAYPEGQKSLISRVLQVNYTQQWCTWSFPQGKYNQIPSTPDLSRYRQYGDLNFSANRLAFIDGSSDVWLDFSYHSTQAPERYSTELHPEQLINGAGHHWDSYGILDVAAEPQFIREAHYFEIRLVQQWLQNFKSWRPGTN